MSDRILIATYDCEKNLLAGTRAVRAEGLGIQDVFAPYPVHGLDRAMGLLPSRLTWACGALGLAAAIFMTWFQHWTSAIDWPINIGGKPWNSLPAFAPVIFEMMVLCAGLGTVLAFFLVARLRPWRKTKLVVEGVTNDRFALVIEHDDARLDLEEMRQLLAPSNPVALEERAEHAPDRRSAETGDNVQDSPWLGPVNVGLLIVLLLLVVACIFAPRNFSRPNWEIFPEMMRSPAYGGISENPNFPDHMTSQKPVVGAIARDLMPIHYQATEEDALAAGRELVNPLAAEDWWLSPTFFAARTVGYLVLFTLFAWGVSRRSRTNQATSGPAAALFLIVFAIGFSLAGIDWVMSLTPEWFSTMWGVYQFSGIFLTGLAVITLVSVFLQRSGPWRHTLTEDHLRDLGSLTFGFSCFWMYIWLSQYMLIWYANIPEETFYFADRVQGTWGPLFVANIFLNWVIPFFVLIPRTSKRSATIMTRVAIVILLGRWLDLYLMVFPTEHVGQPTFGFCEIGSVLGTVGIASLMILYALRKHDIAVR